jgi:hypothetical protein
MDSSIVVVIAALACGFGQAFDCLTTDKGLAKGFKELFSWSTWLYNKIGAGGFYALKCIAVPAVGVVVSQTSVGVGPSVMYLLGMAAFGWIVGIRNYSLLHKSGIKVF